MFRLIVSILLAAVAPCMPAALTSAVPALDTEVTAGPTAAVSPAAMPDKDPPSAPPAAPRPPATLPSTLLNAPAPPLIPP